MTVFFVAIGTFIATFLGGLFALRFKDKLHLVLGFSAGAVIGVAFFDLLPEAIELGSGSYPVATLTSIVALGFVCYLILDRLFSLHSHDESGHEKHSHRANLGAGSLSVHSFLDGVAIGLGFQVSAAIGAVVATAVLVHDFSDGINTVNLVLKNGGEKERAFRWLFVDAVAPLFGVFLTGFISLPQNFLGIVLALFCGFFLYIGASDLLPESHHAHPTHWTTLMVLLGMGTLYLAVHLASF